MCIFCGGQCGGAGDFFISLGLPFLALYYYKLKNSLVRIKNGIFRGGSSVEGKQDEVKICSCCGEKLNECKILSAQAINPEIVGQLKNLSPDWQMKEMDPETIELIPQERLQKKERKKGVGGWLLFLCFNLTIILPFSCLYGATSAFEVIYSPTMRIPVIGFKNLLLYHKIVLITMTFLAVFSFYAGSCLWEIKPKAAKIAKIFLLTYLGLMFLIFAMRPFMVPLYNNGKEFRTLIASLIPFLSYSSVWFLYLTFSRRVRSTFRTRKGDLLDFSPKKRGMSLANQ